MKIDIKVPEVGESVQEAILAEWFKENGDHVEKDEPVFVLETDKVTLEVPADESGTLEILVEAGETVEVGKVVGRIDTEGAEAGKEEAPEEEEKAEAPAEVEEAAEAEAPEEAAEAKEEKAPARKKEPAETEKAVLPPSVRRLVAEKNVDVSAIVGSGPGGRITKGDVITYLESRTEEKSPAEEQKKPAPEPPKAKKPEPAKEKEAAPAAERKPAAGPKPAAGEEAVTRKPMSPIRKRIASHLLDAKQNTAMLTTFNEIDMSRVSVLRNEFKDRFQKAYGVRLGFMSFFVKAVVAALKEVPEVNAAIDGSDIVYHHYYHVGIASGAEKGLVVPVIRHADQLGFAEIESAIVEYAKKVRDNKLSLSEMEGGTFTITNGGIYGSLLSTPILNMPQSGILGMHNIEDRPVAVDGQVVIRPMMYVALSYDHRIVDGKNAVTFLWRIKEFIETPERIMMEI